MDSNSLNGIIQCTIEAISKIKDYDYAIHPGRQDTRKGIEDLRIAVRKKH